jgi:hypothetical protein
MLRRRLLLLLTAVVPLGIATKFYSGPAEYWVYAHAGGILYVVFWILLGLSVWPRLSPWLVASIVFAITCALELLQLWHPPALTQVRSTFLGHALIGSSFSWLDLPHYLLGGLLGLALVRAAGRPSRPIGISG